MALTPIVFTGLGEPMIPDAFQKMNDAIDTINNVLGGGATGEVIRKDSGTDFDFSFTPQLKQKVISISNWNMLTTEVKQVAHGLTQNKIRTIDVSIINDANTETSPLSRYAMYLNSKPSGGFYSSSTNIVMYRDINGVFADTDYQGTGARGYIVIQYAD